jgi:PPOX class probable F420-dependent enzyme
MHGLTQKEREILNGKNFVFVATINPDGSPQVSPVWTEVENDLIVINTAKGRIKERNIARDPRVALSAYDQADPYDEIIIRGEVVSMAEAGAREHIDKLSRKYLGRPYPWPHDADHRVIIRIRKR